MTRAGRPRARRRVREAVARSQAGKLCLESFLHSGACLRCDLPPAPEACRGQGAPAARPQARQLAARAAAGALARTIRSASRARRPALAGQSRACARRAPAAPLGQARAVVDARRGQGEGRIGAPDPPPARARAGRRPRCPPGAAARPRAPRLPRPSARAGSGPARAPGRCRAASPHHSHVRAPPQSFYAWLSCGRRLAGRQTQSRAWPRRARNLL